jgi:ribosomal-protein-alanine N-acetyltransferase
LAARNIEEELVLTPLLAKHATALAALHARCFPRPWKAAEFRRYAEAANYPGLLAWKDHLAGFVVVSIAASEAEILTIGTDPSLRRSGIASALLSRMTEDAARRKVGAIFLEVGVRNDAARSLYQRHGFTVEGKRKGYYETPQGPEDALIMKKTLVFP